MSTAMLLSQECCMEKYKSILEVFLGFIGYDVGAERCYWLWHNV